MPLRMRSAVAAVLVFCLAMSLPLPARAQFVYFSQNCLHFGWNADSRRPTYLQANFGLAAADVIALQEVMPQASVPDLSALAPPSLGAYTLYVSPPAGYGSYKETYAFLVKNTLTPRGLHTYPDAANEFSRPPAGLEVTTGGHTIWVVTYHAVFGKSITVRRTEVSQMHKVVTWFTSQTATQDMVIGGDWNLPTGDNGFQGLSSVGFTLGPNAPSSLNPKGVRTSAYDHFAWRGVTIGGGAGAPQVVPPPPPLTDRDFRSIVSDHLGVKCQVR